MEVSWCTISPNHFIGEPVKTTRIYVLLLALFVCLCPSGVVGQSHGSQDAYHQRKNAEKYQKHIMKLRRKQEKKQAKAAKAYRKQHQKHRG